MRRQCECSEHLKTLPVYLSVVEVICALKYFIYTLQNNICYDHRQVLTTKDRNVCCNCRGKIVNNNDNNDRLTAFDPGQPG